MAMLKPMELGEIFEEKKTRFLDTKQLREGEKITVVALVTKVSSGVDKFESGFYTFYVKDVNSNTIAARLFNAEGFIEKGLVAKSYENKPAIIQCIPQIFNGSWSLVVKDINMYSGEFDYARFRGKINIDVTKIEELYRKTFPGTGINPGYATACFSTLANGKSGGFIKLLDIVLSNVSTLAELAEIQQNTLNQIVFYSFACYYELLKLKDTFPIINNTDLFDILERMDRKTREHTYHMQIMDCCRTILDFGKPQSLIAHLVYNSIKFGENSLNLIELNNTLAKGASARIDGGSIMRY